jgi:hypothetical protein
MTPKDFYLVEEEAPRDAEDEGEEHKADVEGEQEAELKPEEHLILLTDGLGGPDGGGRRHFERRPRAESC